MNNYWRAASMHLATKRFSLVIIHRKCDCWVSLEHDWVFVTTPWPNQHPFPTFRNELAIHAKAMPFCISKDHFATSESSLPGTKFCFSEGKCQHGLHGARNISPHGYTVKAPFNENHSSFCQQELSMGNNFQQWYREQGVLSPAPNFHTRLTSVYDFLRMA